MWKRNCCIRFSGWWCFDMQKEIKLSYLELLRSKEYPKSNSKEESMKLLQKYRSQLSDSEYKAILGSLCSHTIEGVFFNEEHILLSIANLKWTFHLKNSRDCQNLLMSEDSFDKELLSANLIGALTLEELYQKESILVGVKLSKIIYQPIEGSLDYSHLKSIHKYLFLESSLKSISVIVCFYSPRSCVSLIIIYHYLEF